MLTPGPTRYHRPPDDSIAYHHLTSSACATSIMKRTPVRTKATQSKSHPPKAETNVDVESYKVLLRGVTGSQLKQHLSQAPRRFTTEELQLFMQMLKKLDLKVDQAREALQNTTKLHCVRCHKQYLERNNGIGACYIDHEHIDPYDYEDDEPLWACSSCGKSGYGDDARESIDFAICFRGSHTTDPTIVDYCEDSKPLTCEDNGCNEDFAHR